MSPDDKNKMQAGSDRGTCAAGWWTWNMVVQEDSCLDGFQMSLGNGFLSVYIKQIKSRVVYFFLKKKTGVLGLLHFPCKASCKLIDKERNF